MNKIVKAYRNCNIYSEGEKIRGQQLREFEFKILNKDPRLKRKMFIGICN